MFFKVYFLSKHGTWIFGKIYKTKKSAVSLASTCGSKWGCDAKVVKTGLDPFEKPGKVVYIYKAT